ncbi:MAG: deoxyribodipyrimidine photo-lyase [Flaviaesturariibacter sp.]|nr:deoxyribodipyrimidine photo-lyase [Flaviaesturariibacter sp.]
MTAPVSVFWFRRDLRLDDNTGLAAALMSGRPVLPLFIFDTTILSRLEDHDDARVGFIHDAIEGMQKRLVAQGSTLLVLHGDPLLLFQDLLSQYNIAAVYANEDYEPAARARDESLAARFGEANIGFHLLKDTVLFHKNEIVKDDGRPYSVFTPYYNRWRKALSDQPPVAVDCSAQATAFWKNPLLPVPGLSQLGFQKSHKSIDIAQPERLLIERYHETRDTPAVRGTTRLGVHLRFGTIGIRTVVRSAVDLNETFLKELAWREFFVQQLWHHPRLAQACFKPEYENIAWRNDEEEFRLWCEGRTGYPLVDAGMRELASTGFMHNRVRMIAASFLVKHLLIDWRWGAAWFAQHLLDYELSSNSGNWQWVAGCGCDAAPYFRIFNPTAQAKRWDAAGTYISQWIPEWNSPSYPAPIVDHALATKRCLEAYKQGLGSRSRFIK